MFLLMNTTSTTPTTWNGAAKEAVAEIEKSLLSVASWFEKIDTKAIRHEFEHISGPHFTDNSEEEDNIKQFWKNVVAEKWTTLGAMSLVFAIDSSLPISGEHLLETLVRKQTDYGHLNIAKYGRQGLIIRVHDKIARLENLVTKTGAAKNEPIEDTLLDIAGYSAIGIMWERGTFLLPLE